MALFISLVKFAMFKQMKKSLTDLSNKKAKVCMQPHNDVDLVMVQVNLSPHLNAGNGD